MEGLRKISHRTFNDTQRFNKISKGQIFNTIAFAQNVSPGPSRRRSQQLVSTLSTWIVSPELTAETVLKLVCLTCESDMSLNVSRDAFSDMMLSLRADPSVLYMICHVKDGFHFYPEDAQGGSRFLPTWFVGTSRYVVLWIFNEKAHITMGIVIERQCNNFVDLTRVLDEFIDYIHAPQVMCIAIAVYQLHCCDAKTESALRGMQKIETSIGFGPRSRPDHLRRGKEIHLEEGTGTTTFTIDEIMALLQNVHGVAGKIKSNDLLRRSSARILEDVIEASAAAENNRVGEHDDRREKRRRALQKLSEAVPVLQRQMEANKDYPAYMQYRAGNLSQVVSITRSMRPVLLFIGGELTKTLQIIALLTHEDASATIDLAAASRKDTSSMKTIAIMTMIFLPATFFAAFFSLPLLQWDQPQVFHSQFWVYWAFSIPCTAAVFGVWLATPFLDWRFVKRRRNLREENVKTGM